MGREGKSWPGLPSESTGPGMALEEGSGKLKETMVIFQARNGESLPWDRERASGKEEQMQKAQ